MTCPNCSSEVWDNTAKVQGGWKGPLLKCKDKTCGWVRWPDPPKKQSPRTVQGGPKWTWAQLSKCYHNSLLIAEQRVTQMAKGTDCKPTMADLLAATATIFICATRDGVKDVKPAEPPPEEQPEGFDDDDPAY